MFALLLSLAFSPAVERTGHPLFQVREDASATLARWWPLSRSAVERGVNSPDAEVRARCVRIVRDGQQREVRLIALLLLHHEYEYQDLPWARHKWAVLWGSRDDVRRELSILVDELNLRGPDRGDVFGFEYKPGDTRDVRFQPYPYGLDTMRFRVRGLSPSVPPFNEDTTDFLRAKWAQIKRRN